MRTSFHHQSEAQPLNGPLTAATSPDTPSPCPARQCGICGAISGMCKSPTFRRVMLAHPTYSSPARAGRLAN